MSNIVRPWAARADEPDSWTDLIEGLYAHSDLNASQLSLRAKPVKPLNQPGDIALVADVIEALKDESQALFARPALRHALKEIAKATLICSRRPNEGQASSEL